MADPKLETIEQVSDGWIKKYVLTYRMPDGAAHTYEVASRKNLEAYRAELYANAQGCANEGAHPDAVSIVGETPAGSIVLIREFRYPLNSWCIAFPAGLVEPGEDLAACADRELREETGYGVRPDTQVVALPQAGYSSTGLTDETVLVVFAQVEKVADATPEPNELIEVFELPRADVARFLDDNKLPIGTRCQLVLEGFANRH